MVLFLWYCFFKCAATPGTGARVMSETNIDMVAFNNKIIHFNTPMSIIILKYYISNL